MTDGSPTVRRRELGAILRRYRNEAGMTIKDVTDRLLVSATKISRLETGQRPPVLRDVRDLCDLYGVHDPDVREKLMKLARDSRQEGWWQRYDVGAPSFQTYMGLEAEAATITTFKCSSVPGLLQTVDYIRALGAVHVPPRSDDQVQQLVETRLRRQQLLTEHDGPALHVVLDEAVIRRPGPNTELMAAQARHIVDACANPRIVVQVLPFSAGLHVAMDCTFVIFDFKNPEMSSIVFVESLSGDLFIERVLEVERFKTMFGQLAARAMSVALTMDLLRGIGGG